MSHWCPLALVEALLERWRSAVARGPLPSQATRPSSLESGAPINSLNSIVSFPSGDEQRSLHTSGFVDPRRCHSLYVHSPSFGAYNSVGPRGERTITAKIPCAVGYGQLVTYQSSASEHDYIEAGVSGLTTLRLELRESGGRLLDLHGTHWSATLLFEL